MSDRFKVIKSASGDVEESTNIDNAFEWYLMKNKISSTLAIQRLKKLCVEKDLLKDSSDIFNTVKLGRDQ